MNKFLFFMGVLNFTSPAWAITYTAKLYELNSDKQKLLYQMKREETNVSDNTNVKTTITEPTNKKEAVIEELLLKDGKILKYQIHQKQLGDERTLEVKDGKVIFTTVSDGKTKTDQEDLAPNLVVGPTVIDYLKKNWKDIVGGETISIRFAVLERRDTVGFKFFKESELKINGKDCIVVKMKPTSFIIAAVVNPLLFTFEKDSVKLLELKGRTLLKQNVNGTWKDLDADIVYEY